MTSATLGFILGFILGGLFGTIMLFVIITGGRADEREERLFEEYLKRKNNFICLYESMHGELPMCDGRCSVCPYADEREEKRPTMNEVREAFGFPPVEQREEEPDESIHGDHQG